MKTPPLLLLSFVTVFSAGPSHAQGRLDREPPAWGEIPPEHLEMNLYAPDSSAAAVILADFGRVSFDDDLDMVFERHTRVKILTEAGYEWATVTIPYHAEDRTQRVTDIQGHTYWAVDGNGVEIHKMNGESIFDEDVEGEWKQIRFTLPALQPGAVISIATRSCRPIQCLFRIGRFRRANRFCGASSAPTYRISSATSRPIRARSNWTWPSRNRTPR
ncbi:MAG: DUF3857 domain-containing protein [Gemmatimonadota bacterium]|nr:DUF3857 domain-containing protein [Gemmatimonadota bacterium]